MAKSYRDLEVWQTSVRLVVKIYQATKSFPEEEMFGLTAQMRRAAISIPSNIAEGAGRGTRRDYAQFVAISCGSCCELETQCILCVKVGLLKKENAEEIFSNIAGIGRMLKAMRQSLREKPPANDQNENLETQKLRNLET